MKVCEIRKLIKKKYGSDAAYSRVIGIDRSNVDQYINNLEKKIFRINRLINPLGLKCVIKHTEEGEKNK